MVPDYIVVGAGSAGAALAARLSEDPETRVLLLEAGGKADHWSVRMPLGYYLNYGGGPFNWAFHSTPQETLAGRRVFHPRGRGLGGSSAINGMAFLRGHPRDYDRWAREGAAGWSHRDVLPYFKRMETNSRGESQWRGGLGPVRTGPQEFPSPISEAFVEAGRQAGFPLSEDFNGVEQEGFGYVDASIDKGVRASTAHAYLTPARGRANLSVRTDARAIGLAIEGRRVVGVRVATGRSAETLACAREVILSAGAFSSPHLLMLSGIGPADHLRQHGIDVLHDLPGVGGNLQDHLEVHISWRGPIRTSFNCYAAPLPKALAGMRWFLNKSGVCATNAVIAGAFTKSRPDVAHPDIQYHFFPFYLEGLDLPAGKGGFTLCVGTLRAESRGTVRLASADPEAVPLFDFNYLREPADLHDLRACVHQARDVAAQPALRPYGDEEQAPWASARSDAAIDQLIRERAESAYHPCGTCKMGTDDLAVVDPQLRVRGLEGLRVADASIFPSITSGNLNAPAIMVGERAADLILGEPPLARADVPNR